MPGKYASRTYQRDYMRDWRAQRKLGEDLRRHEDGCAVRGCVSPAGFTRVVMLHSDQGPRGGNARTFVLGYCRAHLDELEAFKAQAA